MAPTIVRRAQWGARPPRNSPSLTTWSRRVGVAVHHSAGPTNQTVRVIQNNDMDADGFSDIGYNWLVDQSGKAYEGRAGGWLAIGAHAGGQNTGWIGICWIGHSGNVAPTEAALSTIKWLTQEAERLAGHDLQVRGHGQVPGQATECPGSRLRAWIAAGMPTDDEEEDVALSEADLDKIEQRAQLGADRALRSLEASSPGLGVDQPMSWVNWWLKRPEQAVQDIAKFRAEVAGQFAGLVAMLQELINRPDAPVTPEQFAQLMTAVQIAASQGAETALENTRLVVGPEG